MINLKLKQNQILQMNDKWHYLNYIFPINNSFLSFFSTFLDKKNSENNQLEIKKQYRIIQIKNKKQLL